MFSSFYKGCLKFVVGNKYNEENSVRLLRIVYFLLVEWTGRKINELEVVSLCQRDRESWGALKERVGSAVWITNGTHEIFLYRGI